MLKNFLHSVNISLIKHFIYISSDAVYGDYKVIKKESSRTNCNSIHGLMHLTRELILRKFLIINYVFAADSNIWKRR